MSNIILFTGLPRMNNRFIRSVSYMVELVNEQIIDEIRYVTWEGALDDKPQLKNKLLDKNVNIIVEKESPIGGKHNVWHQMKALDIGLSGLKSHDNILKTRPEVYIDPEFVKNIFNDRIEKLQLNAQSGVFSRPIWTPFFSIDIPFRLCDYCFFGKMNDIKKLVNYDARYDVLWDNRAIHIRMFSHPYIKEYSFLKDYLRYYQFRCKNTYDYEDFIRYRMNTTSFGELLGFYYKIMTSDFYVNYGPVIFKNNKKRDNNKRAFTSLNRQKFLRNFKDQEIMKINCWDSEWLSAHFASPVSQDIPDTIINGFNRSFKSWREFEIEEEILIKESKREREYIYNPKNLPQNKFISFVSENILSPLGIRSDARDMYLRLAYDDD